MNIWATVLNNLIEFFRNPPVIGALLFFMLIFCITVVLLTGVIWGVSSSQTDRIVGAIVQTNTSIEKLRVEIGHRVAVAK